MSSKQRQRREHWKNDERHYCAVCNAWMGSDRHSILLHENGKKHKENQEKALQKMRLDKKKQENDQKFLQSSLQKMEQAAVQSHLLQDSFPLSSTSSSTIFSPAEVASMLAVPSSITPSATITSMNNQGTAPPPPPPPPPPDKKEWLARKKRKEEERNKDNDNDDIDPSDTALQSKKFVRIEPGVGTYEYNGRTYLEGDVFWAILEEDMPVQLWTGSHQAGSIERKLPERDMYWKNAIVATVRQSSVHVAYLATPDDTEETMVKNVPFERIRIILGADDSIPDTLEEARLMAMGGEEISVQQQPTAVVDESTGLSTWSTITVKRTTIRQEVKEERAKLREQKRKAAEEAEAKEKEAKARKMEEAKVANADDSALGAYDVWGRGGYKGVNIAATDDSDLTVADTAKTPATFGKGTAVFKQKKRKLNANRSRRTTSADDDD